MAVRTLDQHNDFNMVTSLHAVWGVLEAIRVNGTTGICSNQSEMCDAAQIILTDAQKYFHERLCNPSGKRETVAEEE